MGRAARRANSSQIAQETVVSGRNLSHLPFCGTVDHLSDSRLVFALDIGTRKVAGLLADVGPGGYRVRDVEVEEHAQRAMLDGQIHDVDLVAQVVRRVAGRLSERAGFPLKEVAVAAAGRSLRTVRHKLMREVSPLEEITPELVFATELEAVQAAEALLRAPDQSDGEIAMHCVGYSTVAHYLDGSPIANLVGQRGGRIGVEIIATFLPRVVLDSMATVLQRAGLELSSLTLEPIAAIAVVIPPTMRRLNLALVDIGAGTSDIAITAGGSVVAYGMVPVAGDEVTEALCEQYLLDFPVGEQVKRALSDVPAVTFRDVLGSEQTVASNEICQHLAGSVDNLAEQIAGEILRLNGKSPQAVMLVGGGALTPGLPERLAAHLGLPAGRVAIQGRDLVKALVGQTGCLQGPDCITPIGIALMTRERQAFGFNNVYVNGRLVRLVSVHRGTVADALLAAGIKVRHLHGRPGPALTVEVNGKPHFIRGTLGRPGQIRVNDQPATLETVVVDRDRIRVVPGEEGEPGSGKVGDVVPHEARKRITIDGDPVELAPVVLMNGVRVGLDATLVDGAKIVHRGVATVGDCLAHLGLADPRRAPTVLRYTLNGVPRVKRVDHYRVTINGAPAGPDTPINDGDAVTIETGRAGIRLADLLAGERQGHALALTVNGEKVLLPVGEPAFQVNGAPAAPETYVRNGDAIAVSWPEAPMVAELLKVVSFPVKPPTRGQRLKILVNGEPAEFITHLHDGDSVELGWEGE